MLVATRKIAPWKIAPPEDGPDPNPTPKPNPNLGGNLLGQSLEGQFFGGGGLSVNHVSKYISNFSMHVNLFSKVLKYAT